MNTQSPVPNDLFFLTIARSILFVMEFLFIDKFSEHEQGNTVSNSSPVFITRAFV